MASGANTLSCIGNDHNRQRLDAGCPLHVGAKSRVHDLGVEKHACRALRPTERSGPRPSGAVVDVSEGLEVVAGGMTAIDREIDTGDESSHVAGQEDNGVGDLFEP